MSDHSYTIRIEKPCHENWNDMSLNERGRFCQQCCKVVTDFTNLTDAEIIRLLEQSNGQLCGRLTNDQLNRPLVTIQQRHHSPLGRILASLLLLGSANAAMANRPEPVKTEIISPLINEPVADLVDTTHKRINADSLPPVIRGQVIDSSTKEVIPFANVRIENTYIGATTDTNGNFAIHIPDSLRNSAVHLRVSYVGYHSTNFIVNTPMTPVKIVLALGSPMVMGEMIIVTKHSKRWWKRFHRKHKSSE